MNESIRMTTTTTALMTPIATPMPSASAIAGTSGTPSFAIEVRDRHAGERHDAGEREVEHARRERDRDRQRGQRGDRVGVEDLLRRGQVRERLRHPEREHDDDAQPDVDRADRGRRPGRAAARPRPAARAPRRLLGAAGGSVAASRAFVCVMLVSLRGAYKRVLGESLAAEFGGDPAAPEDDDAGAHREHVAGVRGGQTTVRPFRDSSAIRS